MPDGWYECIDFQYPLRACGLSNDSDLAAFNLRPAFQYPLRAYGLSNSYQPFGNASNSLLSVPSTGLWAEQHVTGDGPRPASAAFSTLYGPMG